MAFDIDDFNAERGEAFDLLVGQKVTAAGTGGSNEDFSSLDSLTIKMAASLQASTSSGAPPSVTLLVEHSDDGDSWSTAATHTYTASGSSTDQITTPKRFMRARWTVAAGEWFVRASVVPAEVNPTPEGSPGGSLPDGWTVNDPDDGVLNAPLGTLKISGVQADSLAARETTLDIDTGGGEIQTSGGPIRFAAGANNRIIYAANTLTFAFNVGLVIASGGIDMGENPIINLPTSDPGVAGALWNNAGTPAISAG